ncbi:MAG: MFS transporter [Proteobacteria bacterium]|nr:MFS transporter [Pseudomonadota bacterium]
MDSTRRNVALLAACQAMLFSSSSTLASINGLAGMSLAATPALGTLPVTTWVLGGAIATMPASLYMKRAGRTQGLMAGAGTAIVAALICALAMGLHNFWLLCFGTLVFGASNATGQYYRFAAADVAPVDYKARAISLVLAGGLLGGIIGPGLSRYSVDAFPDRFLGAYLVPIIYALVTIGLLSATRIPDPTAAEQASGGRPLREIARQPKFAVAVLSGAVGYGVMNLLMTATPIAMGMCGHPFGDAAFVVSSHVIAMFAPSLVAGSLIKRFGVLNIILAGAALNVACVVVALNGVDVAHFWLALVLVGVGWNFMYIGGTTLLTETYRPEERAKAQGANDMCIFVMMVLSSLTSGFLVSRAGWDTVNLLALPVLAAVAIAAVWLAMRKAPAAA